MDIRGLWNKRRRVENMVYTVGENYGVNVKIQGNSSFTDTKNVNISTEDLLIKEGMSEALAMDNSLYAAAHEGAHVRLSTTSHLTGALKKMRDKGADVKNANAIMQITEDYRVDSVTTKSRPGFKDLRERANKALVDCLGREPSGDTTRDTLRALSSLTYNNDNRDYGGAWASMLDWPTLEKVADFIMTSIDKAVASKRKTTSKTSMEIAEKAYDMLFGTPTSKPSLPNLSSPPKQQLRFQPTGEGDNEGEEGEALNFIMGDNNEEEEGEKQENPNQDVEGEGEGDGEKDECKGNGTDDGGKGESEERDDVNGRDGKTQSGEGDPSGNAATTYTDRDILKMVKKSISESQIDKVADKQTKEKLEVSKAKLRFASKSDNTCKKYILGEERNLEQCYGGSLWTTQEKERIRRTHCRATHAGVGIHYCKGRQRQMGSRADHTSPKRKESLRMQGVRLAEQIREYLQSAKSEDSYISDNGAVVANRAWRPKAIGDVRIFRKHEIDEVGDFVIDLLIDVSGSQSRRIPMIRHQAYVIATACSTVGIPLRIVTHCTEGEAVLLRRYRDYDEGKEANNECFKIEYGGSNRDGLAVSLVSDALMQRPEPNKLLILLSDGLPAHSGQHIRMLGGMDDYSTDVSRYEQNRYAPDPTMSGTKDTAIIIRRLRSKGIALMGIYVGHEQNVETEKLMFGNDFAYIREMKTFVPQVAKFLKKQITAMV